MDNRNQRTITAANSTFFLTVPGLYDSPVKVEGYSTDAMVSGEATNPVVAETGVDGHVSFGFVPTTKAVTIKLAADSPSQQLMEDWVLLQNSRREVMLCNAEFALPGIGRKYVGIRGGVTTAPLMPDAAKTLQPTSYTITFETWESTVI